MAAVCIILYLCCSQPHGRYEQYFITYLVVSLSLCPPQAADVLFGKQTLIELFILSGTLINCLWLLTS